MLMGARSTTLSAGSSGYLSPIKVFWQSFSTNTGALIGLFFLLLLIILALLAHWTSPFEPQVQFRDYLLTPPVWVEGGNNRFWLGTDELGRDILSRLIFGARLSLGIGFSVVVLSMLPGIAAGLLSAFFPRTLGVLIMRLTDILMALPSLLLGIAIIAVMGQGLMNTVLALSIVALPGYIRLVRASALEELKRDYVLASRLAGAGFFRQMFITVLPNCMAPLIVHATMSFSVAILEAAVLGFLGLGVPPPLPEWGTMLSSARDYIQSAWWVVTFPGLAITLTVLAINLVGDGLRDTLDPKMKHLG